MTVHRRVDWTDGRAISGLVVLSIALVTWIASLGVATEQRVFLSDGLVGSAAWALGLTGSLGSYEGPPPVAYERDLYDRGWIDQDGDCQSNRHEVLIAESESEVTFRDNAECVVVAGVWIDPYEGAIMTEASEASIDHVVSLADAHRSGGWQWSADAKQAFANDIDDPATLAVVSIPVNMSKGSGAPDQWLPDDAEARCRYAIAWVRIKTRWQLSVTPSERSSLEDTLRRCAAHDLPGVIDSTPLLVASTGAASFANLQPVPSASACDERYENVCIPLSAVDLDCGDIEPRSFNVTDDPHHFDGNNDGVACE